MNETLNTRLGATLAACVALTGRNLGASILLHEIAQSVMAEPVCQNEPGYPLGPVRKTAHDWSKATGLSSDQTTRALELLRDSGLITCSYSGGLTVLLTEKSQMALKVEK